MTIGTHADAHTACSHTSEAGLRAKDPVYAGREASGPPHIELCKEVPGVSPAVAYRSDVDVWRGDVIQLQWHRPPAAAPHGRGNDIEHAPGALKCLRGGM